MRKWLIPIILILVCVQLATAVQYGENITLRSACVDSYGNLCTDTARWTVIYPDGSTLYNNSLGGVTAYGINELSLWLNKSGAWFAYVNHSNNNITGSFNVVVEDYTTETEQSIFEVVDMTGVYVLLAMVVFLFAYLAMKMSDKHAVIRWFFALISVLFVVLSLGIARVDNADSSVTNLLDTAFYVSVIVMSVLFLYAVYYVLFEVLMWICQRLPEGKQPEWYKKKQKQGE